MHTAIIITIIIISLGFVIVIASRSEAKRVKRVLAELEARYELLPDSVFSEQCQARSDNEDIAISVRKVISETTGVPSGRIHANAPLSEFITTGFDGGDPIELVMAIEERFSIEIPDKVAETLETPSDVFRYVLATKHEEEQKA